MADNDEPPRKFYGFRAREFERANQPRPPAPGTAAPAEANPGAEQPPEIRNEHRSEVRPEQRIEVHDLIQQATQPGRVLAKRPTPPTSNDVHAILRDNLSREAASGLHMLAPKPTRRSRRRRDYFLIMTVSNLFFGSLAAYALHSQNAVLLIYSVAGIGLVSASVTWVMWFVMEDY